MGVCKVRTTMSGHKRQKTLSQGQKQWFVSYEGETKSVSSSTELLANVIAQRFEAKLHFIWSTWSTLFGVLAGKTTLQKYCCICT